MWLFALQLTNRAYKCFPSEVKINDSKHLISSSEQHFIEGRRCLFKASPVQVCVFPSFLPSFLLPFFPLQVISCADIPLSTLCLTFITLLGCHLQFPISGSFATYLHKVANTFKTVCLF